MDVKQLEINLLASFKKVKSDIVELQQNMSILSENQKRLLEKIESLSVQGTAMRYRISEVDKKAENPKIQTIEKVKEVRVTTHKAKTEFVASKTGKKFHALNCVFAKNIHPHAKIHFKSKTKALNKGYKACDCVKRI